MSAPDYDTDPVSIERHFELDAGHRLSEHNFKCQNLHGHRYVFDITIEGYPDADLGYVIDFSNVKSPIMEAFDHNFIFNEDDPLATGTVRERVEAQQAKEVYLLAAEPTAENIALEAIDLIWQSMSGQERMNVTGMEVDLYETPNCKVTRRVESTHQEDHYGVVEP